MRSPGGRAISGAGPAPGAPRRGASAGRWRAGSSRRLSPRQELSQHLAGPPPLPRGGGMGGDAALSVVRRAAGKPRPFRL